MQQNHVREHCSQCGSSNIYFVERPMSPCDMLAMIPRALGLFSPTFFSLYMRGSSRRRRQDKQYRCLSCNRTWHIMRERTAM